MTLREKLKRRFTGKKASDASDGFPPRRKDIEYYKPNEIPKSKYRGKVDKVHQAQLDAYSLEGAFTKVRRRASLALSGTFSPGGSNARSAAASADASAANSRRPSYARARSHLNEATNTDDEDPERSESSDSNKTTSGTANKSGSQDSSPSLTTDATDSPISTQDISRSITAADSRVDIPGLTLTKTITAGDPDLLQQQYDQHFSAEELEKAMTRATLRPRRGTVVAPLIIQPEEFGR
jgi:hypothetical protein